MNISALSLSQHSPPVSTPTPEQKGHVNRLTKFFKSHIESEQKKLNPIKANTPEKMSARQVEIDHLFNLIRSGVLPLKKTHSTDHLLPPLRVKGSFLLIRIFIGKGAHKSVSLCIDLHTLEPRVYTKTPQKNLEQSIKYQQLFQNVPQIIQYLYAENYESCHKTTLEKRNKTFLVIEYCNHGSLEDFRKSHQLSNREIFIILEDCLIGLSELEKKGLCHRSIKEANILLTKDSKNVLKAKIADLDSICEIDSSTDFSIYANWQYASLECLELKLEGGFKRHLESAKKILKNLPMDSAEFEKCQRSLNQVIKRLSNARMKQDIWAMGIVLWKLKHGNHRFNHEDITKEEQYYYELNHAFTVRDSSFYNSLYNLTYDDPEDSFLQKLNNLMLEFNPEKRPTATECLNMLRSFKVK